jgi:protein-S-isoprenylcysteine O-methyltransferase Ste14
VPPDPHDPESLPPYLTRVTLATARKWTFIFGAAAVLTILVGAGFANMSASDAPTTLETEIVRWVALVFAVFAFGAYLIGRSARGRDHSA